VTALPTRVRGVLILAMGLALGWWQVYRPLTALARGETEVTISNALIGFAAVFTVLGTLFILIGPPFERLMHEAKPVDGRYRPRAVLFFYAPIVLLTIGSFLFVKMRLAAMGFTER